MIDAEMKNLDKQLTKSGMPPKVASRFLPNCCVLLSCGGCLAIPLLLIISLCAYLLFIDPTIWYKFEFVNAEDIPNIHQKLAGEWVVERPYPVILDEGNKGWKKTKILLKEDGTCEVQNLARSLTNASGFYPRRYPELTEKTLTGTWKTCAWIRTDEQCIYIIICLSVDDHVNVAPDMPPESAKFFCIDKYLSPEANFCLGTFSILEVEKGGSNPYRLRWCFWDESSTAPILKRSAPVQLR